MRPSRDASGLSTSASVRGIRPSSAAISNNLAWLYQGQGRYAEAEPLVTRSLDLIEKSLGTKADYGRALDTLAKIHEGQGRVSEAENDYRRALEILEASLGDAHESVAATRENLGGLLKSLGRLDEAELLLNQALDTKQRVYGRTNTTLASVLTQLGDLYRTQGKSGAAEAYFLRALAIHKENTREIDVYFATNRAPVEGAKTVAFGSLPAPSLTFGLAKVIVTNPNSAAGRTLSSEPFVEGAQVAQSAQRVEVTEVARLAIHTITTGVDWASPQSRKAFEKQVFVRGAGLQRVLRERPAAHGPDRLRRGFRRRRRPLQLAFGQRLDELSLQQRPHTRWRPIN